MDPVAAQAQADLMSAVRKLGEAITLMKNPCPANLSITARIISTVSKELGWTWTELKQYMEAVDNNRLAEMQAGARQGADNSEPLPQFDHCGWDNPE